jgi:thiol-disulfide isomerase/thioredoxin
MKKLTIMIVLAFLCENLTLTAQTSAVYNGLKPGDKMPEITVHKLYNYPVTDIKLSALRGRLLMLDFWATWCSPCVAMMPKMDSLQKAFKNQILFLPVSNQPREVVTTFLKKLNAISPTNLPDVLEDTVLNNLFPHTYLPHYVWINGKREVIAITEYSEVTRGNIILALAGQPVHAKLKDDHQLADNDQSFFGLTDSIGQGVIRHKLITTYQEDLPSKYQIFPEDSSGKLIRASNLLMPSLFNLALGEEKAYYGRNRTIYEVKDTSKIMLDISGEEAIEWMRAGGHVYSYEVKVPPHMGNLAYKVMQQDLKDYFKAYTVTIEKRGTKCLALVRTSDIDKLKSKGGHSEAVFDGISGRLTNFPLRRLVAVLASQYMSRSPYPIIDQTGYTNWVDLQINARLSDVKAVNAELARYDLALEPVTVPIDMMVIRDNKQSDHHLAQAAP